MKAAARRRIEALRDKSAAEYSHQLDQHLVEPPTTMKAVHDYTKLLNEIDDRDAGEHSISVIDDWLDSLRADAT